MLLTLLGGGGVNFGCLVSPRVFRENRQNILNVKVSFRVAHEEV